MPRLKRNEIKIRKPHDRFLKELVYNTNGYVRVRDVGAGLYLSRILKNFKEPIHIIPTQYNEWVLFSPAKIRIKREYTRYTVFDLTP
ncbi:MAG: hypothetical protein B5M53_01020 [Candidatus Cloacimonas sp. 4484_209]|nr:MAG: hypothetical protein B5M53_01020 [Candidatus Cloacimonas sp. 4484_209]